MRSLPVKAHRRGGKKLLDGVGNGKNPSHDMPPGHTLGCVVAFNPKPKMPPLPWRGKGQTGCALIINGSYTCR